MTNPPEAPIAWHCLLGEVLEKFLTPVGLLVYTELPVMNQPPRDILITHLTLTGQTCPPLESGIDSVAVIARNQFRTPTSKPAG